MFHITDVFHITHVVDDLDESVAWYERLFSPVVFQRSEMMGTHLALLAIGDVVLMPLMPTEVPTAAARFRAKFGTHLHSLAVHVEGPDEFMTHMDGLGYALNGARGGPVEGLRDEIWTKPRDFPGLYELWAPRIEEDPRLVDGWSSRFWRDDHPLGLLGPAWVTVLTANRAARTPALADAFCAPVAHETASTPFGTASTFLALGPSVVVEVAEPTDPAAPPAADLAANGEIMHAVTFEVGDIEAAARHLQACGLRVERPGPGHLVVDPDDAHGARFRFTETSFRDW